MIVTEATLAQLVERLIRNQQVAGSIPAGGSIKSIIYKQALHRIGFRWVQFAGVSEPLGFFFNNWSNDSTATRTLSGTDLM